jgi:hypothetical protein
MGLTAFFIAELFGGATGRGNLPDSFFLHPFSLFPFDRSLVFG